MMSGSRQPESVEVSFYVVLEPKWSKWYSDSEDRPILDGARLGKATVSRPSSGRLGGVVTKLRFNIDTGLFLPLQPEAVIHLSPSNTETIEVEALDPREEE